MPSATPGWPLFACSTSSAARQRIVLAASLMSSFVYFMFQRPFTSAAASAASFSMASQSFDASASLGTIHVPPQATISGTAR